jgi:hypothetical protein
VRRHRRPKALRQKALRPKVLLPLPLPLQPPSWHEASSPLPLQQQKALRQKAPRQKAPRQKAPRQKAPRQKAQHPRQALRQKARHRQQPPSSHEASSPSAPQMRPQPASAPPSAYATL